MNESRETNNAAALLIMEGRYGEARDLLRNSLEIRLGDNNPQQAEILRQSLLRCVTPDVGSSQHGSSTESSSGDDAVNDTTETRSQGAARQDRTETVARPATGHTLFNVPFEINNDTAAADTAVIVFNMALAYQLEDRTNWKARLFYEVSAILQLIRGIRLELLDMATMNNLAVWCYENHDNNTNAQRQFEESIQAARSNAVLSASMVEAMLQNLQVSTQVAVRGEEKNNRDDNQAEEKDDGANE